jgi:hypothetical protein
MSAPRLSRASEPLAPPETEKSLPADEGVKFE